MIFASGLTFMMNSLPKNHKESREFFFEGHLGEALVFLGGID